MFQPRTSSLIVVFVIALVLVLAAAAGQTTAPAPPTRSAPFAVVGLGSAWPEAEPVNAELAALGRLLFYDPVLSGSNSLSCATCHHPDRGFADGLPLARGGHGQDLRRSSPSLWNVATASSLFWDGRATSIEEQMLSPLQSAEEMGADLTEMLAELGAIPEYVRLFDAQFRDGITLDNVIAAIAAFQRTLVSRSAPVDRYVAGDFDALTPAQRRGFDIFRSGQARCIECHTWPTFEDDEFHVLGVPLNNPDQPDTGRAEVAPELGARFAFRTPTLRNVALTAPYMHNGSFATLEEVIQFYEDGGGAPGVDVPVDEELRGFRLTPQQDADLIAFLHALTDEPAELIQIPARVPSGLPPVTPLEHPQREASAAYALEAAALREPRAPQTFRVMVGDSIQVAVDKARPGDTVEVAPGTYYETVTLDVPNVTLRGLVTESERPWLDGQGIRSYALVVLADGITFAGFGVRDFVRGSVTTGTSSGLRADDIVTTDAEM